MQVSLHDLVSDYLTEKLPNFNYSSVYGNSVTITTYTDTYNLAIPYYSNLLIELPILLDKFILFVQDASVGAYSSSLGYTVNLVLEYIRDSETNTITGLKEYKSKEHEYAVENILQSPLESYGGIINCTQQIRLIEISDKLCLQRELSFNNGKRLIITNLRNGTFNVEQY